MVERIHGKDEVTSSILVGGSITKELFIDKKKLYRNRQDAKLLGVIEGVSDFTSIDVGLLRLIFLGVTIATAGVPGVAFYFIAAIVLDPKPTDN